MCDGCPRAGVPACRYATLRAVGHGNRSLARFCPAWLPMPSLGGRVTETRLICLASISSLREWRPLSTTSWLLLPWLLRLKGGTSAGWPGVPRGRYRRGLTAILLAHISPVPMGWWTSTPEAASCLPRSVRVLNRHGGLVASEVRRVLLPGGVLLTQQVGSEDCADLNEMLAAPPAHGSGSWTASTAGRALSAAGLSRRSGFPGKKGAGCECSEMR